MFKKVLNIYLLLAISFLLNSCFQDVIDIDLEQNTNQIVIEAVLTDQPETQYVKVSTTGDYFNDNSERSVSGAVVTMGSSSTQEVVFEEVEPGLYRNINMKGEPGLTYNLTVNVNGKIYTASSTMPEPIPMDSIKLRSSRSYFFFTNYELTCYFTDKKDVRNYCWFKYFVNGEQVSETAFLYNDRNSDGRQIKYDVFDEFYLNESDKLRLEVIALDENAYNYIYSLFGYQTQFDVDLPEFFPSNSFNPNTNISNGAYGYFSACAVKKYNIR